MNPAVATAAAPTGVDPVTGPAAALAHIGTIYGAFGFACVMLVVAAIVIVALWRKLGEKEAQLVAHYEEMRKESERKAELAVQLTAALQGQVQVLRERPANGT